MKSTVPKAVRAREISVGGSARGVNPLVVSLVRYRSASAKSAFSGIPSVKVLSFPLFRPQGLKETSRGCRFRMRRETAEAVAISARDKARARGCSSAGRAPALQAGGRRFESAHLHQHIDNRIGLNERSQESKSRRRIGSSTTLQRLKSGYR